MTLLVAPKYTAAAEVKISYEDYTKTIINKPICDPVLATTQAKSDCFYRRPAQENKTPYPQGYCNCVLYAQSIGLILTGYGAAKNYPVTSKIPSLEGFVVTYEGSLGHIAHYILSGQYLLLQEANYVHCQKTFGRLLPINSPLIKGFI